MTGLDANAHAPLCAASMVADFDACPDNLVARQVRLAEAIFENFFRQLKLINTVMIELPLGWLRGDAEPERISDAPVEMPDPMAIEAAPAPQIEAVLVPPPVRKPRKAKSSRQKPVA